MGQQLEDIIIHQRYSNRMIHKHHSPTPKTKISFGSLKSQKSSVRSSRINEKSTKDTGLYFRNLRGDESFTYNQKQNKGMINMHCVGSYSKPSLSNSNQSANNKGSFELRSKQSYRSSLNNKIEQIFVENRRKIQSYIQKYNCILNEIMELLTDMQIKDLMKFNTILERNEELYRRCCQGDIALQFQPLQVQNISKIYELQKYIESFFKISTKQHDFRSTVDSKTITKDLYPRQSHEINHKQSRVKESLQDTPQSIKSKISEVSNKIRPNQNKKIGMFDRIDVCESMEGQIIPMSISFRSQDEKQMKKYRYGKFGEQQQQQ